MDECMDDGWMHGWIDDGRTDRWMDMHMNICPEPAGELVSLQSFAEILQSSRLIGADKLNRFQTIVNF